MVTVTVMDQVPPLFVPKDAGEAARLLRARANEVGAGG